LFFLFIQSSFPSYLLLSRGSGDVNEGPNASDRGGGRPPTGRERGRGRLAAWFRL
jgi:hypothetical protein